MIRRETRRVLRAHAEGRTPAVHVGRSGPDEQEAARRLRAHVGRLVACRRAWAHRLFDRLARPVLGGLRHVDLDEETLRTLRLLAARGPLVFLPAHRSYIDSLVLDSVLRDAGLDAPWRLAGDNLAFWPLGPLGRRTGTIFIRRDFGTDPTYHAAVRCCLADLLARGQSLEWFPEAGRSRTGRLRPLRSGLMRLLVAAYRDSGAADVYVVPVSITYDSVPDTEALAELASGAAKVPESLRAVRRYLAAFREAGPRKAWLGFGTPVSLRELDEGAPNAWSVVRVLMRRVEAGLRATTRVTPESLLAMAFPADAHGERTACDADTLAERVSALLDFAAARRIPVGRPVDVQDALETLVRARVLVRVPGGYMVSEGRERVLAYYCAVAEHWFMPRAAAELVAAGAVSAQRISELLTPVDANAGPDLAATRKALLRSIEAEVAAMGDGGWEKQPVLLAPRLLGPILQACDDEADADADADADVRN